MKKQLKVLLINSPIPSFIRETNKKAIPISLLYLASTLQKENYEVKIFDINNNFINQNKIGSTDFSSIIGKLNSFKPDLIGISCFFSGRFKSTIKISKEIKKYFPNTPIVLGGIHPTLFPKEILNEYSCIDYICIGEGEKTLVDLMKAHFTNKDLLKDIDGLAYRKGNEVIVNEKTSFIENLDDLPFPAYDLINLEDYYFDTSSWRNPKNLPINIPLPIISSRSCPNQCTFCSNFLVQGKKWRFRSAKNVVDEIEYLYNKYNHRYFSFTDDNFTLSKKRTLEIANEIVNRKLNIQFNTINGLSIKTLDKEVMDSLVKAGLIDLCVAPESGSEYIRNKCMNKNISTEKIYKFFNIVKDYKDLFIKAFFIIGYPQETKETLQETYDMIKKISSNIDEISIFNLIPFPGTEIFEYCKNKNLLNVPLNNLCNLETFSHYNDCNDFFIKLHDLKAEDLIKFKEKAYKLVKPRQRWQNN